jgi:glucokinase
MSPGSSSEAGPRILGIDMGGTTIRAGLLDSTGRMVDTVRVALPTDLGQRRLIPLQVAQSFAPVDGIGFAVAGTVDSGVIRWTANLGLDGTDVGAMLSEVTAGPVIVVNDARAAGLAEARHAAGDRAGMVLVITVGTGIGGAIIIDGQPWNGTGQAGEVGHMMVVADGPPCGCGNRGCWETLCGGRALDRAAAALGRPAATAADLAAAAATDERARTVVDRAAADFARGLDNLCAVLAPHAIVLGGGILARGGVIARAYLAAAQNLRWVNGVSITPSSLGDDAGLIGAALLAAQHVTQPTI